MGASALTSFLLVTASLDDLRLDLLEDQWLEDTKVFGHRLVRVLHALQPLPLLAALYPEPERVKVVGKFLVTVLRDGAASGQADVGRVDACTLDSATRRR